MEKRDCFYTPLESRCTDVSNCPMSSLQDRARQAIGAKAGLPLPLLWTDSRAHCVPLVITAPKVPTDSVTQNNLNRFA